MAATAVFLCTQRLRNTDALRSRAWARSYKKPCALGCCGAKVCCAPRPAMRVRRGGEPAPTGPVAAPFFSCGSGPMAATAVFRCIQ